MSKRRAGRSSETNCEWLCIICTLTSVDSGMSMGNFASTAHARKEAPRVCRRSQISMGVMLLNSIAAAVRRGGCWRGPRDAAMEKPARKIRPEFHSDCAQRALGRHGKCSLKGQPYAPVRCRIVEIRDASGHNTSGNVGIVQAPCAIVVSGLHRRGDCIQQTPGKVSLPLTEVPRILVQQRRKDCIAP
jgi:hypothetical protein